MKKLTAFILATILVSVGMSQLTLAGYGGGYNNTNTGGGTAGSVAVGTTTITGGSSGNCLYNNSGVLGDQTCSAGANTALSNLITTAINTDLLPGTPDIESVGSPTVRFHGFWGTLVAPTNSSQGFVGISAPTTLTGGNPHGTYGLILPQNQGAANQVLTTDGSGPTANLSWSTTMATYDSSGAIKTTSHIVQDTCTLGTNCSITLTGSAVFTSSSSYTCLTQDETAIAATKCVQTSGSALVITGTGTDVIKFALIGN